jgi:hypothetical protein
MTARARPPSDAEPTEVYDPQKNPPRPRSPTKKGQGVEIATPTELSPPRRLVGPDAQVGPPPAVGSPGRDASGPIQVFSMKAADARSEEPREVKQHQVKLRPLSELAPRHPTPPGGLGYIAPPRDPRQAQRRRWRDYVIWGSLAVILGCAIMIGVWFLGR